ncbi:MAG: 2,3-bisphosphoglycerate-independent phosphoglycerate mutase [Paracoccaceae bacterium]|nr:2,3-bisphosphoglycerate-independent phosphoglycerate mutase [Paracoccaceae bacterium]
MDQKPVVLCILDGWGHSEVRTGNAPYLAKTPNIDRIMAEFPASQLITHGPDVGLPEGQMGNSEVGHVNIGAGRVVAMDLGQIDLAIQNKSFFENPSLKDFISTLQDTGGVAHVISLISDGGVHGHMTHLIAALQALDQANIPTEIHTITDGRDVAPSSALTYLSQLEGALPATARIATVCGRYYAMDRDNRWERVKTAFDAMINGVSDTRSETAETAIKDAYAQTLSDEFIPATVIADYAGAKESDGVFCLNFRADRAREILAAIAYSDFDKFDISGRPEWSKILGMVPYSKNHDQFMTTCFPKEEIVNTLGAWVAKKNKRQFRLAETEKYPHVTFFFNGGKEAPEVGEDRNMPKSPNVATYDLQPEMSSKEVTEQFVTALQQGYDIIIVNYANPDMVGHTGDLQAAIKACESIDQGLGKVMTALKEVNGKMLLTADHGNCETMIDPETQAPHTAHTLNLVPVSLINAGDGQRIAEGGRLCDIAPTLLELMGLEKPVEMTGLSLLRS